MQQRRTHGCPCPDQTAGVALSRVLTHDQILSDPRPADALTRQRQSHKEWGCQESGSGRSFNVAQSFEPFFDYGSFFSGVLRPFPAFGVCTAAGPDGVLFDEGRLKEILQHATIHVFWHGLAHEM